MKDIPKRSKEGKIVKVKYRESIVGDRLGTKKTRLAIQVGKKIYM